MKTMLLLTGILLMKLCTAQMDDYNGPAKIAVNSFWDMAAKLEQSIASGGSSLDSDKLAALKGKLKTILEKDPACSRGVLIEKIRVLAEGIDSLKKKNDGAIMTSRDKTLTMQKVDQLFRGLFHISTDVDRRALGNIKEVIEEYKKRTAELQAADKSANKKDLERYIVYLKSSYKSTENDLYELDRRCREQTVAENAEVQYYELQYKQAYWDAAQKIYPDVPEFKRACTIATTLLEGLGSLEDVHKLAGKSKQQKINDTRLPAAVIKDAALEMLFVDVFNKYHGEEFKGTATKAVITSDDWSIQRNEITGIVTGRIRRAVIVYKGKDGKCFLTANFFIHQEYVGNAFISAAKSIYPVMGSQEMLCANVK